VSLDLTARETLRHYPLLDPAAHLQRVAGGFSGAAVWRVGELCLRAWPESGPDSDRLQAIHRLMGQARAAGLDFVPAVLPSRAGGTRVEHAGRLWDLTAWMPGRADFHDAPTPARLDAACTALARLHTAWARPVTASGPCPAVLRRLASARDWLDLVASGWRPAFADCDPVTPSARRAWELLRSLMPPLPVRLAPWAGVPLPLQPCLCDVWHAHVLFTGEAVTGVVDYGSVKVDHVAVDLARLLGGLVEGDARRTAAGLTAYARLRALTPREEELVGILDETGTVLAAANWLRWLYRDGHRFDNRAAVAERLARLVARLERFA
jgi:Ser/Thr protein kinase RdoA (MazF antagonist)